MAKIKPLRGLIYNREIVKDLSGVVCPPYDVISFARQQYYHELNSYNLIHILLGKDVAGEDKYQRGASYFRDWIKNRILLREEEPCIYFYSHEYKIRGAKKTRFGFIGLLSLDDKKPSVHAHEHTRLGPKEDRFKLLGAVKANLSPIFVLFCDKNRIIPRLNEQVIQKNEPFMEVVDDEKNTHRLWRIKDTAFIEKVQNDMRWADMFIADGHHRYEVACAYKEQMKHKTPNADPEAAFNYILTYFTNVESPGLTIMPIHRLVKVSAKFDKDAFLDALGVYFDIQEFKDKTRFFFLMEKAGTAEHVLGMYKDKIYRMLRLKNIKMLDKLIPDKPKEYRALDVSILNYVVLNKVLGLPLEDNEHVDFNPDADEVIGQVDAQNSYLGFFLNAVKVKQLISVALAGEKMPPKSTYFYPKVLSGLVINPLTD